MSPYPTKIDWEAAFSYYAALGSARSFEAVARRFGVTGEAVGQRARQLGWRERVAKIDARARRDVDDGAVRELAVRRIERLQLIDELCSELRAKLRAGEVDVKPADLAALVKIELLLEGEATERVDVRQVQAVFVSMGTLLDDAFRQRLDELALEDGVRAAVVSVLRELYPRAVSDAVAGVVELEAGE